MSGHTTPRSSIPVPETRQITWGGASFPGHTACRSDARRHAPPEGASGGSQQVIHAAPSCSHRATPLPASHPADVGCHTLAEVKSIHSQSISKRTSSSPDGTI